MYFGSATNILAIIGACAIVFWIICWLILMSKSDFFPHFVQSSSAALAAILAFCTAIPSAILALPIWLNFRKVYDSEYRRGLHEKFSDSSSQLKKSYDEGYNDAAAVYKEARKKDLKKVNEMYLNYCALYHKCQSEPNSSLLLSNVPVPDGFDSYLKYHAKQEK